eukprot:jgi/Chlat1/8805/Chrsp90S08119
MSFTARNRTPPQKMKPRRVSPLQDADGRYDYLNTESPGASPRRGAALSPVQDETAVVKVDSANYNNGTTDDLAEEITSPLGVPLPSNPHANNNNNNDNEINNNTNGIRMPRVIGGQVVPSDVSFSKVVPEPSTKKQNSLKKGASSPPDACDDDSKQQGACDDPCADDTAGKLLPRINTKYEQGGYEEKNAKLEVENAKPLKGWRAKLLKLDGYGGEFYKDPRFRNKKTATGALLASVCRLALIAMLCWNAYQWAHAYSLSITGDLAHYHLKGAPSLQRIDIADNFGYDDRMSSGDPDASLPHTVAAFGQFEVPIETFPTDLSMLTPDVGRNLSIAVEQLLQDQRQHKFYPEIIKALTEDPRNGSFMPPHQATLADLARLKKCQLQVSLVHARQMDTVQGAGAKPYGYLPRSLQGDDTLSTLAAGTSTWDPSVFQKTSGSELDDDFTNSDAGMLDWKMAVTYVNNFNHTVQSTMCARQRFGSSSSGSLSTSMEYTSIDFNKWFIKPPGINDTTIILSDTAGQQLRQQMCATMFLPSPIFDSNTSTRFVTAPDDSRCFPFQLILSGMAGTERVNVIGINATVNAVAIKVERPNPIDFKSAVDGSTATSYSTEPPSGWVCKAAWYNSGASRDNDGCHCGCGAWDPDCAASGVAVYGCYSGQVCSSSGNCTNPLVYKNLQNTVKPWTASSIAVSEPCEQFLLPGETTVKGFVGSLDAYAGTQMVNAVSGSCTPCPGDVLKNKDQVYVCNFQAEGYIDPRTEEAPFDNKLGAWRINVTVDNYTPFPTMDTNGSPYYVVLDADTVNAEKVRVIRAANKSGRRQELTVDGGKSGEAISGSHLGRGDVLSSLVDGSLDVFVMIDETKHSFAEQGPYNVTIGNLGVVTVQTAVRQEIKNATYQRLALSSTAPFFFGKALCMLLVGYNSNNVYMLCDDSTKAC